MSLGDLVRRLLPTWRPSRTVELEPVHQRILTALLRFGDLTFDRLQAEVSAEHETPPGETLLALVKLESDGLITRQQLPEQNRQSASYTPSPDGRRVARLLPHSSASSVDFRI